MTMMAPSTALDSLELGDEDQRIEDQSVVFENASWSFYQRTLREIGEGRRLRVNYFEGRMEIVSPLPIHEELSRATAKVIWCITDAWQLPSKGFGSSTFFAKKRRAGLEPDECFYFQNASRVIGMKRFSPSLYPPPDLAIEVETTRPAVAKLPIYAALGVPEIWRWERGSLHFYRQSDANYLPVQASICLPRIEPRFIETWIQKFLETHEEFKISAALRELAANLPEADR